MTTNELVQFTKRRLTIDPMAKDLAYDELEIMAAIPAALQGLGRKVMQNPNTDALLQQDYSVILDASGVGNLFTATGSITGVAGELLYEAIPFDVVIDADNNVLVYLPHYADFLRPATVIYGYYTTVKERIFTRAINTAVNGPTDIVGVNGPLTVTANFAPASVANVPTELTDDLIDIHVGIMINQRLNIEQ